MGLMEYQGGSSLKPDTPGHFDTACSVKKTHDKQNSDLVHLGILLAG